MYPKDYCTTMLGNTDKRKVALGIYSAEKQLKSHLLLKCLYWGRVCVRGPEEKVGLRNRQRESMLRHRSCVGSRLPVYWSGVSKPGWSRNTGPLRAVALKQEKKKHQEEKDRETALMDHCLPLHVSTITCFVILFCLVTPYLGTKVVTAITPLTWTTNLAYSNLDLCFQKKRGSYT